MMKCATDSLTFLFRFTLNEEQRSRILYRKIRSELRTGDYESFLTRLEAFFADIPYELNDQTERHYQVIFYLVFKLMGQFTEAGTQSRDVPMLWSKRPNMSMYLNSN